MHPKSMATADRVSSILSNAEELKKRALQGTEFEQEEDKSEASPEPESKPVPVKCEAASVLKARMCKIELRSPGLAGAGVADVQESTAAHAGPDDDTVPATLPASVSSDAGSQTPRSRQKRRASTKRSPEEDQKKTPKEKHTKTPNNKEQPASTGKRCKPSPRKSQPRLQRSEQ